MSDRDRLNKLRRLKELRAKSQAPSVPVKQIDTYSTDPTEGMTTTEKFLAGAGKAFVDVGRGAKQIYTELLGDEQEQAQVQAEIDEAKRLDDPLLRTGAGVAGNIAGGIAAFAPTALVPGAATLPGAALAGGLYGVTQPVASNESRLANVALGSAGGALGHGLVRGASRVLAPKTDPMVRALMQKGVTPTPGQVLGGTAKRLEEGLSGVPVLGEGIRSAQKRAIFDFNKAIADDVLAPIGKKLGRVAPTDRDWETA